MSYSLHLESLASLQHIIKSRESSFSLMGQLIKIPLASGKGKTDYSLKSNSTLAGLI